MSERVEQYAEAMMAVAVAEDRVDEVADELFRFARSLETSDELRMTLTDRRLEASRRQQIVEDLLGGKASDTTVGLVSMVVGVGRAGELGAIADALVQRAAHGRDRRSALVRTAMPLDPDQQQRLARALAQNLGAEVDLRVIVDPSVVGGIVTQVGDTVIDGSVKSRLTQLRDLL